MKRIKIGLIGLIICLILAVFLYHQGLLDDYLIALKLPPRQTSVYLIPHQDDEILSFGAAILDDLAIRRPVQVVLFTDGSASISRHMLNGESVSNLFRRTIDPQAENYTYQQAPIRYITPEIFSQLRMVEFKQALLTLGLTERNIRLIDPLVADQKLTPAIARQAIEKLDLNMKTTIFHTFHYDDRVRHSDHAALGQAVKQLLDDKIIKQVEYYTEFYTLEQALAADPELVFDSLVPTAEQRDILVRAMEQYGIWDPANERYAIGYHSVKPFFEHQLADYRNYRLKKEEQ